MNIKVKVDDYGMALGFKELKEKNKIAVRNTLNKAAGGTRKDAVAEIKKDFTLRNTFTVRSVVYDQATQREIKDMIATVGALKRASYLRTQEEGGLRRSTARSGIGKVKKSTALPMNPTRQGGSSAKPVSSLHYITKIQRQTVGRGKMKPRTANGTAKSRSVAQMFIAFKYRNQPLYLKRDNDIFRVKGFNKVGRNNVSAQLEHLYTIHYAPIRIDKNTWLEPSFKRRTKNLDAVYKWELKNLLRVAKVK